MTGIINDLPAGMVTSAIGSITGAARPEENKKAKKIKFDANSRQFMIANNVTNTCKSQLKIPPGVWDSRHGFQSVPAVAILRLCQPLLPAQNSAGLAAACSRAEPLMKPGSWMADSGSLPLSIGFVPFRVAFDKIQAQQTPAGFQPGFGFDAAREKF